MITQGKWEVSDATSDKTSIVMGKFLVAEAHHGTSHVWAHGIDIKEAQANAKLMAASPGLLKAMQRVLNEDNQPEYHCAGMGCGLEDMDITDRYEAMAHGWDKAIDRMYEMLNLELEEPISKATE